MDTARNGKDEIVKNEPISVLRDQVVPENQFLGELVGKGFSFGCSVPDGLVVLLGRGFGPVGDGPLGRAALPASLLHPLHHLLPDPGNSQKPSGPYAFQILYLKQ